MRNLIGEFFGLGNDWAKYISSKTMVFLSGFVIGTVMLVTLAASLFSDATLPITFIMWAGFLAFTFFFFQPAIGYIALVRWLGGRGDPEQKSILCLYAWGVVVILMAGTIGIIANWLNAGVVYPLVIVMAIGIVAATLLTSKKDIEKWLRVIALTMAVVAAGTTLAVVLANNREVLARVGVDTREFSVRPSETAKLNAAEEDRIVRDKREKAKADSVLALQKCVVSSKSQKSFTPEQKALYQEHCVESSVQGMTRDEVKAGWPHLFSRESPSNTTSGETGLGKSAGGVWDSYMRFKDTNPILFWSSLILGHWLFYRWIRSHLNKNDATATKASDGKWGWGFLGNLALIALLGFGVFHYWPEIKAAGEWVADAPNSIRLRDPVPLTDNLIGPGGTDAKEWSAVASPIHIRETGIPPGYPLAISSDSYVSMAEVFLRIRTEGGFSDGAVLPSDLVIRGKCKPLDGVGHHYCRGQWQMLSIRQNGEFEYYRHPTGGSIHLGAFDAYGAYFKDQMLITLFRNLRPL